MFSLSIEPAETFYKKKGSSRRKFAKRRKNACYGIEENVFWTLSCLRKSLTKHLLRFNNLPHWNSVC